MIAAVGLAMGALSTVSSLVEQAATSINQAANPPPAQPFTDAATAAAKKPGLPSVALNPGPPVPKFDKHTQAVLLALQERLHA